MPDEAMRADLAAFLSEPPSLPLLVCTDMTARGIDFPHVQTVINFDFPATSALYLHRAGRTARMGKSGRVLSLVHDSERRFAESIRDAVNRRTEVHTVRKGDLRARKRATEASGRAGARALIGREAVRLSRRGHYIRGGKNRQRRG
jgi:superfamily II DNA/RNA helicase